MHVEVEIFGPKFMAGLPVVVEMVSQNTVTQSHKCNLDYGARGKVRRPPKSL